MSDNKIEKEDTLYHRLVNADVFSVGMPTVYQGKTQAWRARFQSWACRTTEMEYLKELVDARLSFAAYTMMTNNPLDCSIASREYIRSGGNPESAPVYDQSFDMFAKGYAAGIRAIYGDIVKASSGNKTLQENKEDK